MRRTLAAASAALMASAETHKRSIRAHRRALQDVNAAMAALHSEVAASAATLPDTDADPGVVKPQGEDGG